MAQDELKDYGLDLLQTAATNAMNAVIHRMREMTCDLQRTLGTTRLELKDTEGALCVWFKEAKEGDTHLDFTIVQEEGHERNGPRPFDPVRCSLVMLSQVAREMSRALIGA